MRTVTGTISRLSEHCKLPLAVRRPVVEARARLRLQIEACKIHFLQSLGGGGVGTQTCLVHLLARPFALLGYKGRDKWTRRPD